MIEDGVGRSVVVMAAPNTVRSCSGAANWSAVRRRDEPPARPEDPTYGIGRWEEPEPWHGRVT